jgi:hypothetical protein
MSETMNRVFWPAQGQGPMETNVTMTSLRSPKEAAGRLGVSVKTLNGFVRTGELRYINAGNGKRKVRRKFTDENIAEFIEHRTKRDVPCQSTSIRTARSTTSTSSSRVIGFTALQDARANERLKHSSRPRGSGQNNRSS